MRKGKKKLRALPSKLRSKHTPDLSGLGRDFNLDTLRFRRSNHPITPSPLGLIKRLIGGLEKRVVVNPSPPRGADPK